MPRLDELQWIQKAFEEVPVHSMPTAAAASCLLNGRVLIGDARKLLTEIISRAECEGQPTDDDEIKVQYTLNLISEERERMREALVRLIDPNSSLSSEAADSLQARGTRFT
jgi:hypothetical protein